jgi:hypothetical protein
MASPGSKSKSIKWPILYVFTGVVDAVQLAITFTGIGIAVSEVVEVIMPFIIIPALQFTGTSLITRPGRLLSVMGAVGLDAITGGVAPFWIVDIWYIHRDVKKEDAEYLAQQEKEQSFQNITRQALNVDGKRMPQSQTSDGTQPPLIKDGVRAPNGGMKPPIIRDIKPPVLTK